MLDDENQDQSNQKISFESLDILIGKWKDGTFSEIIDDWKWIFSYSKRYKGAIAFYTILGIFSTSMGLVGSVASKYMIGNYCLQYDYPEACRKYRCGSIRCGCQYVTGRCMVSSPEIWAFPSSTASRCRRC